VHGAVQYAVQLQETCFVVQFIFVLAPHRDFDDNRERLFKQMIINVDIVPRVHAE
jgi:hypothetical protein